jgi:hypothetical protein
LFEFAAQADGGGGRRQLGGAVRRRRHRDLLRRELLRPPHHGGKTGVVSLLLDLRRCDRAETQDAAGPGGPKIRRQQKRAAGGSASGDPGLGRRGTQQGVRQETQSPGRPRIPGAAGDDARAPDDRHAKHAGACRRPDQVGDQPRVPVAPGHPVPRRLRLRHPGPGVRHHPRASHLPQQLRHREATAGAEAGGCPAGDGERPGVHVRARRGRRRRAAERGHEEARRERVAPVAPPRARLLGARLRRGPLRPRTGPQEQGIHQHGQPAAAEHGGAFPAWVDGAPVRGGQPGRVGVPLPHRAAPPHGHGRRLRRRDGGEEAAGAEAEGSQRGHHVRQDGARGHGAATSAGGHVAFTFTVTSKFSTVPSSHAHSPVH